MKKLIISKKKLSSPYEKSLIPKVFFDIINALEKYKEIVEQFSKSENPTYERAKEIFLVGSNLFNAIIECLETINDIITQVVGKPIEGFDEKIKSAKKNLADFHYKILTSADVESALILIFKLINKIELEITFNRIDGIETREWSKFQKDYLSNLRNELKQLSISINTTQPKPKKDFKTEDWFKVGLLFAQGKVQPFYIDYKQRTMSFNGITKKLGLDIKKHRTYISSTLNKNEGEPKNIYSSQKKIKQIQDYCIENNIEMCDDFLNQIKPD